MQAKIDYKKHGTIYKVLDDLRERMDPEVANQPISTNYLKRLYKIPKHQEIKVDDILDPKETWMSDWHCRRSILFDQKLHAQKMREQLNERMAKIIVNPKDQDNQAAEAS